MGLKSAAIGIAASLMLFSAAPSNAATFSFNGTFSGDADVQLFSFTVGAGANVTLSTTSYAAGGFDPYISLYDSTGALIFQIDDGSPNSDPGNGNAYDSFVTFPPGDGSLSILTAGTYTLALTQSPNLPFGSVLSDGFFFDPSETNFTAIYLCQNGQFCDQNGNDRGNGWALVIDGVDSAAQAGLAQTPLPAALPLFATGLGVLGFTAYRRRKAAP